MTLTMLRAGVTYASLTAACPKSGLQSEPQCPPIIQLISDSQAH